jgi:ABC-type phosphate/phosphonate transport system substrate-binding protein
VAAVDRNMVLTGAHVASVDAVASGRADLASIDHSIWDWLLANEPERVSGLVVVDQTADWPAPPLSVGTATAGRDGLIADLLTLPTADVPELSGLVAASIDRYRFMAVAEGRR